MNSWVRIALQAVTYSGFAAVVGYLSASPAYDYAAEEKATIKLSLSHAAKRVEPCVRLTPEEIAKLAPNMRRPEKCERERLPLTVELWRDREAYRSPTIGALERWTGFRLPAIRDRTGYAYDNCEAA
jgi:hypothetical protein